MPNSTVYRNPDPSSGSLQDLLNMANYSEAPVETPSAPQAPQVFTEGVMTPQERQKLVDTYLAAPDYGEGPKVNKPNILAQILMGAGDSLSTYASILGNAPQAKTHSLETYMQYLADQKASKEKFDARKAQGKADAEQRKLTYLLGEDQRRLEVKAAQIAEDKASRLLQEKITRDNEAEASHRRFELVKMAQEHELDRQEQESRFKHEEGMKRLEASLRTGDDPKAEKHLQSFSKGAQIANSFLRGLPETKEGPGVPPLSFRLKGDKENNIPPETPAQMTRQFEDEMTQEGIFGPARDLARDYWNERLIRTYREVQKASQPQNPGP